MLINRENKMDKVEMVDGRWDGRLMENNPIGFKFLLDRFSGCMDMDWLAQYGGLIVFLNLWTKSPWLTQTN